MFAVLEATRKISCAPVPDGTITSAKALFKIPYGGVENSWGIKDERFIMRAAISPIMTAAIRLPGKRCGRWERDPHLQYSV